MINAAVVNSDPLRCLSPTVLTQPGRAGGTTALLRYELKRLMSEASKRMMQVAYEDRTAAKWDSG